MRTKFYFTEKLNLFLKHLSLPGFAFAFAFPLAFAFLISVLLSGAAHASEFCTDFSGEFRGADQEVLLLKQQACQKIELKSAEQTSEIILDGQVRLFLKGRTRNSYVTAKIESQTLEITMYITQQLLSWQNYDFRNVLLYTKVSSQSLQEENFLYDSRNRLIDYRREILRKK